MPPAIAVTTNVFIAPDAAAAAKVLVILGVVIIIVFIVFIIIAVAAIVFAAAAVALVAAAIAVAIAATTTARLFCSLCWLVVALLSAVCFHYRMLSCNC